MLLNLLRRTWRPMDSTMPRLWCQQIVRENRATVVRKDLQQSKLRYIEFMSETICLTCAGPGKGRIGWECCRKLYPRLLKSEKWKKLDNAHHRRHRRRRRHDRRHLFARQQGTTTTALNRNSTLETKIWKLLIGVEIEIERNWCHYVQIKPTTKKNC